MERVGNILPKVLALHGVKHLADNTQLVAFAFDWISRSLPGVVGAFSPGTVDGSTLTIFSRHNTAKDMLEARSLELLQAISNTFPGSNIHFLRVLGALPQEL